MSTFQIFPNFSRGGGGIENQIFPKFKIVKIILGGGGQENYGLFPQFATFFVWKAPLMFFFSEIVATILVTKNLFDHICGYNCRK